MTAELRRIAKAARLALSDGELERLAPALQAVTELFAELEAAHVVFSPDAGTRPLGPSLAPGATSAALRAVAGDEQHRPVEGGGWVYRVPLVLPKT